MQHSTRIVWNATQSVDVGFYWITREAPGRGDIAAVRLPDALARFANTRGYLPSGALLLKPIAAVAGDRVCRWGRHIILNGALRAYALPYDARRRPLPTWIGCYTLAKHEVFLLGNPPDSFDGRYFASLATDTLLGRAIPLWTR